MLANRDLDLAAAAGQGSSDVDRDRRAVAQEPTDAIGTRLELVLRGHEDEFVARTEGPRAVVQVGARDVDQGERAHAQEWGIRVFTMREIDERGMRAVLQEAIELVSDGTTGIHVSLDLDFVDPQEAPGVGTPVRGGATYREAHLAMEMLHDTKRIVSMDLVEVNPVLDRFNHTAELAVGLVASGFGQRIL